jgi:hypothetical protein
MLVSKILLLYWLQIRHLSTYFPTFESILIFYIVTYILSLLQYQNAVVSWISDPDLPTFDNREVITFTNCNCSGVYSTILCWLVLCPIDKWAIIDFPGNYILYRKQMSWRGAAWVDDALFSDYLYFLLYIYPRRWSIFKVYGT